MAAVCVKLEPPGGDPMARYSAPAYAQSHQGIDMRVANLKTEAGQRMPREKLDKADVLLTSFRPLALAKLGIDWASLHSRHPAWCRRSTCRHRSMPT